MTTPRKARAAELSGLQSVILRELVANPTGRTVSQLADSCYAGARLPNTWPETVRGQIRRLRPVVSRAGLEIVRLGPYGPLTGPYVLRTTQ